MSNQSSDGALRVRKNIDSLTPQEISDLRRAFQLLYDDGEYQRFAGILITYGHTLQNDLLFLPWARAYFYEFERLLRSKVDTISLPYWDYTGEVARKEGLPEIVREPITDDGEPNPLYRAQWSLPLRTFREPGRPEVLAEAARLESEAMELTSFVDFSTNIWPADIVTHVWIGGSSRSTETTAFDPIFWFSHCNLDRMWDAWQLSRNDYSAPETVLAADLKPFRTGERGEKKGMKSSDVMNTADLGYTYQQANQ